MRRHAVHVSLLLLGVALLAGCGQKGPLFLPTKPAAPASTAPAPAATPAARPAGATTAAAPAPATSGG